MNEKKETYNLGLRCLNCGHEESYSFPKRWSFNEGLKGSNIRNEIGLGMAYRGERKTICCSNCGVGDLTRIRVGKKDE